MSTGFTLENLIHILDLPPPLHFQSLSSLNIPFLEYDLSKDSILSSISALHDQMTILQNAREGIISLFYYLSAEIDKIDLLMKEQGSLLAPIARLPHDILSDIFKEVRIAEHQAAGKNPPCVPVTAQVCRRWRNTSLATTQLWSKIVVRLETPAYQDPAEFAGQLSLAELYLGRSGICEPLELDIVCTYFTPRLMNFIRSTNPGGRWKAVTFDLEATYYDELFPAQNSTTLPFVTSLDLEINMWSRYNVKLTPGWQDRLFLGAPKLKRLFVRNRLAKMISIPFQMLDLNIWIGRLEEKGCLELFKHNRNLHFCHLITDPPGDAPWVPRTPLRCHRYLTTLVLTWIPTVLLDFIPIELPCLRKLAIGSLDPIAGVSIEAMLFFNKWCPQLETLFFPSPQQFFNLIGDCPNLTTLRIPNLCESFVNQLLAVGDDALERFPKLRTLMLSELLPENTETVLQAWRPRVDHPSPENFKLILPIRQYWSQDSGFWVVGEEASEVQRLAMNYGVEVVFEAALDDNGWYADATLHRLLLEHE